MEKSICTMDKAKGQYWRLVIFGPQTKYIKNMQDSVLEINAQAQEHFHNSMSKHILPCNPQMQVKAVTCKEEPICEHYPEMQPSSLDQSSVKMEREENGKLFCGQMNQNWTFFMETTDAESCGLKEERDHLACYQHTVQSQHL